MPTPTEVVTCSKCGRPFRQRTNARGRRCGDEDCADRAKAPDPADGAGVR